MIIYVDLLIILNFFFDLVILTSVDVTLKRRASIKRIFLASIIGEICLVNLLFNSIIIVVLLSFIINIICFGYKNLKYTLINISTFYVVSIVLGGFIYFLFNQFKVDLIYSIRYLIIIIISPSILLIYYLIMKNINQYYNNLYKIKIIYNGYTFIGNGFLDSGNKLTWYGKKVILIEKKYIHYKRLKLLPVFYNSLNYSGIVFCFKPDECYINDLLYKDVLIGLSDVSFNIDGAQVLLNSKLGGL